MDPEPASAKRTKSVAAKKTEDRFSTPTTVEQHPMVWQAERELFFDAVVRLSRPVAARLLVITHFLPDRPLLLSALSKLAPIGLVVGKEYSALDTVQNKLTQAFGTEQVQVWSDGRLSNPEELVKAAKSAAGSSSLIIVEIGGYFAHHLTAVGQALDGRLRGVVEDTESGHRRYEEALRQSGEFPCVVASVARSPLKSSEDALVGPSCVYSVERLIRESGGVLSPRNVLVIGYGRVGRGTAIDLRRRGLDVRVCEIDPIRRALALAEGFAVPVLEAALPAAEVVFGCTGRRVLERVHLPLLKSGVLLASCSSRQIEFDIETLTQGRTRLNLCDGLTAWTAGSHALLLTHAGQPVNFLHAAEIGPLLALVQAEILAAVSLVDTATDRRSVVELGKEKREEIAAMWLRHFADDKTGVYRHL